MSTSHTFKFLKNDLLKKNIRFLSRRAPTVAALKQARDDPLRLQRLPV